MMPKNLPLIFLIAFLIIIILSLYFVDKIYFLCPIEYKQGIIIRRDDIGSGEFAAPRAGGRRHEGLDLYAPVGTEVRAARFVRVAEIGFHQRLGNYVELSHAGNLVTIYGHLQRILVRPSQWVAQGKIIGYVGKTGNANHPRILPHVHFEIRRDDIPINPQEWLEVE